MPSPQDFQVCVKTFFRPAGAMNLLSFVPQTDVRGYILVPLRGPRMMVLFHRRRLRSHTDSPWYCSTAAWISAFSHRLYRPGLYYAAPWGMGTQVEQPFAASLNIL